MNNPETKAEMLQQQVNAKVVWGARDTEVLEWLEERHGIRDSVAAGLLNDAHRAKRAEVRRKALLYGIFSIPGMLFSIVYFVLQAKGGFIIIGYGSVLVFLLGMSAWAYSVGVCFDSYREVPTGLSIDLRLIMTSSSRTKRSRQRLQHMDQSPVL